MAFEYTAETVISAMKDCCDSFGDSSDRNKAASKFLEEYQELASSWSLSMGLLSTMELPEDVLVLAAITLRHRIRNHLNDQSAVQQTQLFERLIISMKYASNNCMEQLMTHLSVAIADLLLRSGWGKLMEKCVTSLSNEESPALFKLLEMLPVEALNLKETQQLEDESWKLLKFLTWLIDREDVDDTFVHSSGFKICASWISLHFLSLDELINHIVIINAFHIMENPGSCEGELSQDASDCLVALLKLVPHARNNQSINWYLEDEIFNMCCSIKLPILEHETNQMNATARLYIQLAESYVGLNAENSPVALQGRAPCCFELLSRVARHCDLDMILSSMPAWHELFERQLSESYCDFLGPALDIFFKKCRLPNEPLIRGSQDFDTMTELRGHVKDMLESVSHLDINITLENFIDKLIEKVFGDKSAWYDVEESLFFIAPFIPKLFQKRRQILIELMKTLPGHIFDDEIHPAVCQQMIILNTECHKFIDSPMQRYSFVDQLIGLRWLLRKSPNDLDVLDVIDKSHTILDSLYPKKLFARKDRIKRGL
ncbi:hypothetical protein ACLKA6_013245 [Drosophila palustris]